LRESVRNSTDDISCLILNDGPAATKYSRLLAYGSKCKERHLLAGACGNWLRVYAICKPFVGRAKSQESKFRHYLLFNVTCRHGKKYLVRVVSMT